MEQVAEYVRSRDSSVDPQGFIDFYEAKGWLIGKTPMKDWKARLLVRQLPYLPGQLLQLPLLGIFPQQSCVQLHVVPGHRHVPQTGKEAVRQAESG